MIRVSENLWRGPRPENYDILVQNKITRVINLEYGFFEAFHEDAYETEYYAKNTSITKHTIRCSDIFPPNKAQVLEFIRWARSPGKTYVHCLTGKDRTGFMCAVYQMRYGHLSFEEANNEWKFYGRHWWYWWWESALKEWYGK